MAGDVLSTHKQGRIHGYKLMTMMIIRNHGLTPSPELMTHFFRLLHVGLTGQDQVGYIIKFFVCSLTGNTYRRGYVFDGLNFQSTTKSFTFCVAYLFYQF